METIEKAATAKTVSSRKRIRCGRPPAERAGEVEERILGAAHKVFLERGFDGASIDLIAETARSGKPTIYSRFPNKEALFEAAVARSIRERYARMRSHKLTGANIEERLVDIGVTVLNETLTEDYIGIVRVALGEARRIPDLVRSLIQMAREQSGEIVAQMLAEVTKCETFANMQQEHGDRYAAAARYFLDLVLLPPLMRALSGENVQELHAEIDVRVKQKVAFFLAACKHGGIA
ncbi:TetR/AcrR family transcriptional regulator [Rhodoblastus acidophilus]|uniref:TetR/AcrR family transcriptional regulator n=1 Tax=Candidatus Rhodoblastus alkanivorans TaxID=2954117 RepID=A0ABS9Z1J2_9HYPH|nr:TetR/AcrR family transcriptional regulator [Candidatus Rhodoblastus alkanivorans]MCI4678582.1 TetR/AcrR family transcriptional regulator [Candidatus Rhodoblastus alkanivorans]MCI4681330.1 TetR/AcrR family transcriptional regulator [Candidatus Rhodoblastus alkanivorans]MDI4642377.1 TetR/AcrR family transcriptional regulator [Rhodoblastus acidophilus]